VIGSVLKEARENINLSQVKIAEIVGVTKQTYLKWENDVTEPKASQVSKLAKALDVTEGEICQGRLNNRLTLNDFIIELHRSHFNSSIFDLKVWEHVDDHEKFISSLVQGKVSPENDHAMHELHKNGLA